MKFKIKSSGLYPLMYRCKKTIFIRRTIVSQTKIQRSLWMKKRILKFTPKIVQKQTHKLPPRKKKANIVDDLISCFGRVKVVDYSVITKEQALKSGSLLGALLAVNL